jgi:hypothetical protein
MMFAVIGLVQEEGKRGRGISSQLEITTKLAVLTFILSIVSPLYHP